MTPSQERNLLRMVARVQAGAPDAFSCLVSWVDAYADRPRGAIPVSALMPDGTAPWPPRLPTAFLESTMAP
jgi:hypothetical protein